jgi:hypothetical protein
VPPAIGPDEREVWNALAVPVPDLDVLAARVTFDVRRCLTAVGLLEAAGHVRTWPDGSIGRS